MTAGKLEHLHHSVEVVLFVRLFYVKLLCDGKSVCAATHAHRFRQTAAQAPALEGPERPFSDKDRAPMADIRYPFTATLNVAPRRALSVRQFGEKRMTKEIGKVGLEVPADTPS